jgi:serine protease AprX
MAAGLPKRDDYEGINTMMQDKTREHIVSHSGHSWRTPAILVGLSLSTLSLAALAGAAPAGLPALSKTDMPLSQMLAGKAQTGFVSVIFKTTAPLTSAQEAQMTALGASIIRRLPIIQSVTVRLPEHNLSKLAALPFAAHLSLDGKVQKSDEFTVGSSEANLATAAMPGLAGRLGQTYQLSGAGVTIAVLDSGVTPVADLSTVSGDYLNKAPSRLTTSVNFSTPLSVRGVVNLSSTGQPAPPTPGSPPTTPPGKNFVDLLSGSSSNIYDPCGHGTHVAGIIAGNANRSQSGYGGAHTFQGIAPQANLVSVRVLDQNGCSDVGTVLAGLQYVLTYNADKKNKNSPIRVVNMSLGHPVGESYTTDPICQAVEALYKSGVVVVCAAGNEGRVNGAVNTPGLDNEGWGTAYGSIQSPGNDPYIITVGATKSMDGIRTDDCVATYSSRGPSRLDLVMKPDIIAPGNKVITAVRWICSTTGAIRFPTPTT